MNLIKWFGSLFTTPTRFTGVIDDTRSPQEKEKDYLHEEIASATVPEYRTKAEILPITEKYYKENQVATSMCVPHGTTLALGIFLEQLRGEYIRLSKTFVYRFRVNFPQEGMIGGNAGDILIDRGSCLFDTAPTPQTEREANAIVITQNMIEEAKLNKGPKYVSIKYPNDIDTLASLATKGIAVPIFIYATIREWAREFPNLSDNPSLDTAPVRHCVCVLPNSGFIENGVKYVAVQDSSKFGGLTIRYLSEEFIQKRVYFGMYFVNLVIAPAGRKPKYLFTKPLAVGSRGMEVTMLQKCLQYEGLFPSKEPASGYFGGITRNAVNAFQVKYQIATIPTGTVGPLTRNKLNELFA
jgi:hypothetical protein